MGALEPKGKGANVTGSVYVPVTSHAYSQIINAWNTFKRITLIGWYGNQKVTVTGRMNAPQMSDDGTKCNFTFVGFDPKIETT